MSNADPSPSKADRSAAEEARLAQLKREMAERLLAAPAAAVYDLSPEGTAAT